MLTDTRTLPLASVRLYDVGEGDSILTDHGTWRYYVCEQAAKFGTYGRDANGVPYLRTIPGIGLTCREYWIPKDTRLAVWTTAGGAWEERIPAVSRPRVYYLHQYSSAADVAWSATSTFNLPQNPHFAFRLILEETPPDHDDTTYPPYCRLEFGGGTWAIEFHRSRGTRLLKLVSAAWQDFADLPEPQTQAAADFKALTVFVRCDRGKIGVSLDWGKSYTYASNADGTNITVALGTVILRGQGMAAAFGLHQLMYYSGTFTSQAMNTLTPRNSTVKFPTLTAIGQWTPHASTITLADAATGTSTTAAKFTATLNPQAAVFLVPFYLYVPPVLPAVYLTYATARTAGAGTYTTPWDGSILDAQVDKPTELDGATCTFRVRLDPDTNFSGEYRWRKVAIILGHQLANGSSESATVFTGYIRRVEVEERSHRRLILRVTADNVTIRAKRARWDRVRGLPLLGNRTVNAALDVCLDYIGLTSSDRSWHARGAQYVLPLGLPENATEWAKEDEPVWDTMVRIATFAGLEIGATDAGVFQSVMRNYVSTGLDFTWQGNPASDVNVAVLETENTLDYSASYTLVVCTGQDAWGGEVLAWVRDTAAETTKGSGRFSPWRDLRQERLPGTVTSQIAAAYAAGMAYEHLPLKTEPSVVSPAQLGIQRRQRVRITGMKIGVGDATDYWVASVQHQYEANAARLRTTAELRKIV